MNDPKLPPNTWTISGVNEDPCYTEWLAKSHGIRPEEALDKIDKQLQLLRDFDNYHRETCAEREFAKIALYKFKKYFTTQLQLLELQND